jgi:hypothetical protein
MGNLESLSSPSATSASRRFEKTPTALLCCPKAILASLLKRENYYFTTPKCLLLGADGYYLVTFSSSIHRSREINLVSITRGVTNNYD